MKIIVYFFLLTFCFTEFSASAQEKELSKPQRYKVAVVDLMILKRQKVGAFKLTHTIGADGLELDMGGLGKRVTFDNKLADSVTRQQFLDTARKYKVEICALSMSGFYAQSFATRDSIEKPILDCIHTAKQMNVKVVFLPLGINGDLKRNPELKPAIVERLKFAGAIAREEGVTIAIETALDAAGELELLKEIGSPAVKISFNFQNVVAHGKDISSELKILGKENIAQIHCTNKDSVWLRNDPQIDLVKIKMTLDKMHWNGWLIIERSRDAKMPSNVKANFTANTAYVKSVFQRKEEIACENCLRYYDLSYGDSVRQKFDLIIPESSQPVPLVMYFYGGGFIQGDKSSLKRYKDRIEKLLNNGIAVAAVNYRYRLNTDSLGVQRCIDDAVRFLQYIRYHADQYHIDKSRIASYGASAGAGISLYLAFHDDMARPSDPDPLRHESTRIRCAAVFETQATYDLWEWKKFLPGLRLAFLVKGKTLKDALAKFYGFLSYQSFKPYRKRIPEKLDMLRMISPDDPPVWIKNSLPFERVKNENGLYHHPNHALEVEKYTKKEHVKVIVITRKTAGEEMKEPVTMEDFLIQQLTKK